MQRAGSAFKDFHLHRNLRPVEIPCSWCGADVLLPAGDFSGVCIECGTVMFRRSCRMASEGEVQGQADPDTIPVRG